MNTLSGNQQNSSEYNVRKTKYCSKVPRFTLQETEGQRPTWIVQTLVPNNTVPIACSTQRTTVQNIAKAWLKKTWPRPERCSALTSCPPVSHIHLVSVIPLCWVSTRAQHCFTSSQAAICKNRHCKWRLVENLNTKGT